MEYCAQWPYEACCDEAVDVTQAHIDMAGFMLWSATNHQFGPCEITVRPCVDKRVCCARCGGGLGTVPKCGCRSLSEITLPGPINSIISVYVDGVLVDPEDYRVDDYHWLVNLVGEWPTCSDHAAAFDEGGSFVVTYEIGVAPPPGAALVAGELACELAKAFCNDSSCRLPRNIQTLTRQGVTVNFSTVLHHLPNVGGWVDAVNNRLRPGRVWSPDMPMVRRTTWSFDPGSSP
jgi:hypothetical protein